LSIVEIMSNINWFIMNTGRSLHQHLKVIITTVLLSVDKNKYQMGALYMG